jgi:hypothetical protein
MGKVKKETGAESDPLVLEVESSGEVHVEVEAVVECFLAAETRIRLGG